MSDANTGQSIDAAAALDAFLETSPFGFDHPTSQQWAFFLLFYADLKEDSDYRQNVDDTYRMTHNPVNQHVALYRNGEQLYSSYSGGVSGDEAFSICREVLESMDRLPPLVAAAVDEQDEFGKALGDYTVSELE